MIGVGSKGFLGVIAVRVSGFRGGDIAATTTDVCTDLVAFVSAIARCQS